MESMNPFFKPSSLKKMSAITREIAGVLESKGFTAVQTGREERAGAFNDLNIDFLRYAKANGEKVILCTHKPARGRG